MPTPKRRHSKTRTAKRRTHDSVSIEIAAPPEEVYRLISDIPRMGEWSPENRGAVLHGPHGPLTAGDVFDGGNTRGKVSWSTRCTGWRSLRSMYRIALKNAFQYPTA